MTAGHVEALRHARTVVDAGTDGLAHVFVDTVPDDAFVAAIQQRGVFVVATLSAFDCGVGADELLIDSRVRPYLSVDQIGALQSRRPRCQPSLLRTGMANVGRLSAADVPILAGSDASVPGTADGVSMFAELGRISEVVS